MNLAGFVGHTEYLADKFGVKDHVMIMVAGSLKIVLLTRHVALSDVPAMLSPELLLNTVCVARKGLKDIFGLSAPRIAVAAFNPHAGRDTFLGKEDKLIAGALKHCPGSAGPFPPDTLFTRANLAKFDCVIALYHDQGMIPFKLLAFDRGVNLTLGLPIIRTSPAHGTAYDLISAGKPPNARSTLEAIKLCVK